MNAVLGSCKYGKCVRCTFDSSVYCLYLYALLHFCEPFLRGGIRATFLPDDDDDNAAGAAEAAETRGCRDGVPGMARGPTCAGPGSAAPLGT